VNSLEVEGMSLADYKTILGEQILLSKVINFEVMTTTANDKEIIEYYEATKISLAARKIKDQSDILYFTKRHFTKNLLRQGQEVIQRLERGEDFQIAGELSEDANKQFGGIRTYQQGSA
jgi:hypothetical protein